MIIDPRAICHPKIKLKPWQIEGRDFLVDRQVALLGDKPRLGKLYQSVAALECLLGEVGGDVLIIVPAHTVTNWKNKIAELRDGPWREWIISYDMISRGKIPSYWPKRFDVCIIDEAHRLGSRSSNRTQSILGLRCDGSGLVMRCAFVWCLSGTFLRNNASEMWPLLRALLPRAITRNGRIMDSWQFMDRYCVTVDTGFGRKIVGGKNLQDLKDAIAPNYLSRDKTVMGHTIFAPEIIPLEVDRSSVRALRAFEESEEGREVIAAFERGGIEAIKKTAGGPKLRRLSGLAKAKAAAEWIKEELADTEEKMVVMAFHRDVIAALKEHLSKLDPLVYVGGMATKDQDRVKNLFQTDPKRRVIICQLNAAGEGVDLSAASELVFVETSFVPADNEQAKERIFNVDKPDQHPRVRILSVKGSIDQAIEAANLSKMKVIEKVL